MEKVNIYEEEQFRVKILIDTLMLCTISSLLKWFQRCCSKQFYVYCQGPNSTGNNYTFLLFYLRAFFCGSSTLSQPTVAARIWEKEETIKRIIVPTSLSFCEIILKQVLQGAYHVPSGPEPQLLVLVTSSIIYFPTFICFFPISSFIL